MACRQSRAGWGHRDEVAGLAAVLAAEHDAQLPAADVHGAEPEAVSVRVILDLNDAANDSTGDHDRVARGTRHLSTVSMHDHRLSNHRGQLRRVGGTSSAVAYPASTAALPM